MKKIGFKQGDADPCVCIKMEESINIVAVYVDDLIIIMETEKEMLLLKITIAQNSE